VSRYSGSSDQRSNGSVEKADTEGLRQHTGQLTASGGRARKETQGTQLSSKSPRGTHQERKKKNLQSIKVGKGPAWGRRKNTATKVAESGFGSPRLREHELRAGCRKNRPVTIC